MSAEEPKDRIERIRRGFAGQGLELAKLPPQALDLEEAVIGAILLQKDAYERVAAILSPESFYKESNAVIYRAIVSLYKRTEPIDILTVTQHLRKSGDIEIAGGAAYISQLTNRVASSAHIEAHARIIAQEYIRRELIKVSQSSIQDAYDQTMDVFDLLDTIDNALMSLKEGVYSGSDNLTLPSDHIKDIVVSIEKRAAGEVVGISTGYPELDEVLHGFIAPDVIIVGGRPSMGKTALALSIAILIAERGTPVGFFSLEMSSRQLVIRMCCQIMQIEYADIALKKVDPETLERFNSLLGRVEKLPIYMDDTPSLTISEIRRRAKKMVKKHGVKMIFLDYLQLARGSDKKTGNREQEISEISRGIKTCAKENNIPVMALAQLKRGESKSKPSLSDLRESGAIEQDADVIIFPYRAEYYGILEDEKGESLVGKAEIIVAKHRNGGLGNPMLNFVGRYAQFVSQRQFAKSAPHPDTFIESRVRQNENFLNKKDDLPF